VSFLFNSAALLLAVYLLTATTLSAAVTLALPRLPRSLAALPPRRRAASLFGLGLLPAAGGLLATLGLALPAWLRHEPRGTGEEAGPVLLTLALGGAVLLALRLGAALLDQWRTSRLLHHFTTAGQALRGLPFEATRLPHELPVAALAGTFRPRLLFSESVLQALSPDELLAVVEHERAHVAVHENLRRLLLRASPDPLALCAAGRRLRADYEEAAETAADQEACGRVAPLLLAGALLKVAGLVPAGRRLDLAVAALHREGCIAARVRFLLAAHDSPALLASPAGPASPGFPLLNGAAPFPLAVVLLAFALALVATAIALLPAVHRILEALVHLS